MIVAHADGLLVDSTYSIPNVEPNYDGMRWWQTTFPNENAQLVIASNNPAVKQVELWMRQFGMKHSYAYCPGEDIESPTEYASRLASHAGSRHTKITLFISTSLAECNWMSALGVPAVHFIPPRPINERYEEDNRSSWEKQSAGIVEVVEEDDES